MIVQSAGLGEIVEVRNGYGDAGIHIAARRGHQAIVSYLLCLGWPLDQKGLGDMTPLHWAARQGHLATCTALIRGGAQLMPKDEIGRTPQNMAVAKGHVAVHQHLNGFRRVSGTVRILKLCVMKKGFNNLNNNSLFNIYY